MLPAVEACSSPAVKVLLLFHKHLFEKDGRGGREEDTDWEYFLWQCRRHAPFQNQNKRPTSLLLHTVWAAIIFTSEEAQYTLNISSVCGCQAGA